MINLQYPVGYRKASKNFDGQREMSDKGESDTVSTSYDKPVDGLPKSGRFWKPKQKERFSSMSRKGILSHMSVSLEAKRQAKIKREQVKQMEQAMKEEVKAEKLRLKQLREEKEKRRMANALNNTKYQQINPEKIKTMSKKQLRMVRKTTVNKHGQVELVGAYN